LIEEEDSHNPITDDQVVKILVKDGIKLSRRTVAKYRDQMNIPGSRETSRSCIAETATRLM
jgi:RNA polymerase sigma-54 factor